MAAPLHLDNLARPATPLASNLRKPSERSEESIGGHLEDPFAVAAMDHDADIPTFEFGRNRRADEIDLTRQAPCSEISVPSKSISRLPTIGVKTANLSRNGAA